MKKAIISFVLRGGSVLVVAALPSLMVPAAAAQEYASVLQYELRFGSRPPVNTFSMAWQSRDLPGLNDAIGSVRVTLYSTDPKVGSWISRWRQMASEEQDASLGKLFGGLLAVGVYIALPTYGLIKKLKQAERRIEEQILADLDLPELPELPMEIDATDTPASRE